jgi:hypothetical protein
LVLHGLGGCAFGLRRAWLSTGSTVRARFAACFGFRWLGGSASLRRAFGFPLAWRVRPRLLDAWFARASLPRARSAEACLAAARLAGRSAWGALGLWSPGSPGARLGRALLVVARFGVLRFSCRFASARVRFFARVGCLVSVALLVSVAPVSSFAPLAPRSGLLHGAQRLRSGAPSSAHSALAASLPRGARFRSCLRGVGACRSRLRAARARGRARSRSRLFSASSAPALVVPAPALVVPVPVPVPVLALGVPAPAPGFGCPHLRLRSVRFPAALGAFPGSALCARCFACPTHGGGAWPSLQGVRAVFLFLALGAHSVGLVGGRSQ